MTDLGQQMHSLVYGQVVHPSINPPRPHKPFIVLNGDLDEEVQREIDDFNRTLVQQGLADRQIRTIVKGELLASFRAMQSEFWATNLHDVKTFLEIVLQQGDGFLPKSMLESLIYHGLDVDAEEKPSDRQIVRSVLGVIIICTTALKPFSERENHFAEFEAWTLCWMGICLIETKWDLRSELLTDYKSLAKQSAFSALANLCSELISREGNYEEGDGYTEVPVYKVRMTLLSGLMGLYGLFLQQQISQLQTTEIQRRIEIDHLNFSFEFCKETEGRTEFWGEYCIPQLATLNFFLRTQDASKQRDTFWLELINGLSNSNDSRAGRPLPNPYYNFEEVATYYLGFEQNKPLREEFAGSVFYLEGLLHLFAKTGWKQALKSVFPKCTKLSHVAYSPSEEWKHFQFRRQEDGVWHNRLRSSPFLYASLIETANEVEGEAVPAKLRIDPLMYLAYLIVCPHRMSSSGLRWIDDYTFEWARTKQWL